MKNVIGSILPLAIAVTISPIPIIAEILLLFTKKPVANAGSYLAGFVVGVAGAPAILVAIAGTVNLSAGSGPSEGPRSSSWRWARYCWSPRCASSAACEKSGEEASMPKWMNGIAGFAPGKSLIVGVGIGALNPKNIIVGVAAAVAIASASLSAGQEAGAIAVYVLVAVLGVAAPLVVMLAMGEKAQAILDSWKAWLGQNNAVVMTVLFLIFAVVLIGKGIAGIDTQPPGKVHTGNHNGRRGRESRREEPMARVMSAVRFGRAGQRDCAHGRVRPTQPCGAGRCAPGPNGR